jgi:AAA ATPase domain
MQRFLFSEYSGTLDGVPNASPARGRLMLIWPRMEQAARPGTVLIAPATLHLVEGFVAVKSLGPVPVKGRSKPVEVYELSGIGPARTRLQAAARRGLTRFVGRDTEIEVLRRSLERAGPGHGQVVAIVGEAGVGKSRLVREFTRSQRTDGWLVLESGSVSYGRTTPYLPVIELLVETIGERLADAPLQIAAQYYLAAASAPLRRLSRDRASLPATDAIATRPTNP